MRHALRFAFACFCAISAGSLVFGAADEVGTGTASRGEAAAHAAIPGRTSESRIAIGLGVKVSTLGIGGEAALPLGHRSNVRVAFNLFNYSHTFDKDGVTYKGSLNLRSVQATYDFFPLGSFHISPGVLLYNNNHVGADASVPGGQTLTFNNTDYLSDAADPVGGAGKLTVYKTAPMLLIGFGNLVPRSHHFSATFEIGAVYQGPPRVTLNLTGSVCDSTGANCRAISSDPTVQANIVAEQDKLNKSASPFRFYPVVSFGIGYKF